MSFFQFVLIRCNVILKGDTIDFRVYHNVIMYELIIIIMNKNRHLISKYLSGELDMPAALRFEELLLSDFELQEELKLFKEVDAAIKDTEVLNLRVQLEAMHEPLTRKGIGRSGKSVKRVIRYAAAAASVAFILAFSFFGLFEKSSITEKFYQPYEITMVNRSSNLNIDEALREAMIRYDNQEYREAVVLFEQVIESEPGMLSNFLYSGISYFEIKEYYKAEDSFQTIINQKDNLYIEQAEWYIGFCYIMTARREKAMKHFSKIAEEKGYFSEKAKKILRKLR